MAEQELLTYEVSEFARTLVRASTVSDVLNDLAERATTVVGAAGAGVLVLESRQRAGLPELHFHGLLLAGNDLTTATSATLQEMTDRMRHSSPRAALIYMHGNDARQARSPVGRDSRAPKVRLKQADCGMRR